MKPFQILITTDIHGSIYSHSYATSQITLAGLSRISSAIQSFADSELILIDNGDVLQGSPLTSFNNKEEDYSIMAKAFNALKYDYINLGNHDFNYGQVVLNRYINESSAHLLTSNIERNHKGLGQSIIHETQEGHKIGLIGVVTDYLPNWEQPKNLANLTIKDVVETVQTEVQTLRSLVDSVVVIYHGGFERDLVSGLPTEDLTGENVGYQLTTIPGIDVLITGHQHRSFAQTVNNVLCLQCRNNGSEFMLLEYANGWTGRIISSADYAIDKQFESLFDDAEVRTQQWLDTTIGTGPDMQIKNVFSAQLHKAPFISFINQVFRDYLNADLAFSSLFNTSPGLQSEISMRDLVASYPFPNTLVLIEIDRETLLAYLEQNASYFELHNNEVVISKDFAEPKLEMYNYDMGDGLSYTIDVSKPVGQRIVELKLPNKPSYTMVVNNYRAAGGGNFHMIKNCKKLKEDTTEVVDILYDYIEKNQPLRVGHQDNIKIIH